MRDSSAPSASTRPPTARPCACVAASCRLPALYDRLDGRANLGYAAELYGLGRGPAVDDVITAAAARFGIEHALDHRVGGYSTGMKTRLALARSILHQPDLLLFDEPTSGLDPESSHAVLEMIQEMTDDGRTVVMCTHLLLEAEGLADQVVVMEDGRDLVSGTPDELTRRYWPGTVVVVAAEDLASLDVAAAIDGVEHVEPTSDPQRRRLHLSGEDRVADVVSALVAAGVRLTRVEPLAASLEDLYFAVRTKKAIADDGGRQLSPRTTGASRTVSARSPRSRVGPGSTPPDPTPAPPRRSAGDRHRPLPRPVDRRQRARRDRHADRPPGRHVAARPHRRPLGHASTPGGQGVLDADGDPRRHLLPVHPHRPAADDHEHRRRGGRQPDVEDARGAAAGGQQQIAGESPEGRTAYALAVFLLAPVAIVVPLTISTAIGASTIVGERERGTGEFLAHSPADVREIYLGKLIASLVPGYGTTLAGFAVYSIVVNLLVGPEVGGWFFPTSQWWVLMLWVVPPFLAVTLSIVLRLSARVKSSAAAQQAAGLVTLPMIGIAYSQSTGALFGARASGLVIGIVAWIAAVIGLRRGMRAVSRSRLLGVDDQI